MNAIFAYFLILTNHIAHGLFNLHLIPILTLWLGVWSFNRVFKGTPSSPKSFGFFERYLPWTNVILMVIKPGGPVVISSLLGGSAFFRFFYPLTLLPLWIKRLSLKKKTALLATGALVYYLVSLVLDPSPGIDVFVANNMGIDYLSKGLNPYAQFYPEALSGGRGYRPGFLYWPGTLYLEGLSRLLFGDIRVVLTLLWWCAPFFFRSSTDAERDLRLKAAWWFLPFLNFCLENAWIDPILAFCAAGLVYGISKKKLWVMALTIGLAASVKQYGGLLGAFAIPYLFFTEEKKGGVIKLILFSGLVFSLLMLPFLAWDLHAFVDMTLKSHLDATTRLDALNFTAWWITVTNGTFSNRAQGIMTLIGFALGIYHLFRNSKKNGLRTLPEAWAITFGFSIVFGKFGFANYYWLWISFLILALVLEQPAKTGHGSKD
jgi:hypothetical protein